MSENIVLSGNLLFLSLADLFQMLGVNNCTGKLTLRSPHSADVGVVCFINGNPANAFWGNLRGLKAVYGLFGWADGKFDFSEEELPGIETVIDSSIMEIVMDALRLLDDGEIERTGPAPSTQKDAGEPAADGKKMDSAHPVKGPLVDYRYATTEKNYTDGAVIVKEGSHGKWLWVICEGVVRITVETAKGPLTLARLGEGCFIGTIGSFLHGEYKRNATVTAEGKVQLCILDADALYLEYSALSHNFKNILLSLDNRLRMLNANAAQAYVGAYARELPKDKVLEDRFQSGAELHIIKEGEADIIGKGPGGDVNLLSLGAGNVVGKIPFLSFGHEPLSASVMTSSSFHSDVLDSAALQKEYESLSHTFRNFVFTTATNISMTTKLFYHLLGKP
jgi:hypothetical protein